MDIYYILHVVYRAKRMCVYLKFDKMPPPRPQEKNTYF